jgi:hypothetical protein
MGHRWQGAIRRLRAPWCVLVLFALAATCAALVGPPGAAGAAAPGSDLWFKDIDPVSGRDDDGIDVAVAADGSVYVLGQVERQTDDKPVVVLLTKYSAGGARRWTRTYGVPGFVLTHPRAMTLDGKGNVLVAGWYENDADAGDGLVVKFSPAGKRLWVKKYDGVAHGDDAFFDIGCDGAGNVYVCGSTLERATSTAAVVRKYSPAGALRWTRKATGFGAGSQASALVVKRDSGAVWVTGPQRYLAGMHPAVVAHDVRTAKYSTAGKLLWAKLWTSPGSVTDVGQAIALESDGEVYVAGSVADIARGHAVVLNYGNGGALHWAASDAEREPVPMALGVAAIGVDKQGRAALAGTYYDPDPWGPHVAIVRRYSAAGAIDWEYQVNIHDYTAATALTVQPNGTLFAAGHTRHFGMVDEEYPPSMWVVRHQADGTRPWTFQRQTGWTTEPYYSRALAYRDGRLYVAGDYGIGGGSGFAMRLAP